MKPILSSADFSSKFNQPYTINTVSVDTLLIRGIDYRKLFDSEIVSLQNIDINGMNAYLFLDKSKPYDIDKITLLPQMVLESMEHFFI